MTAEEIKKRLIELLPVSAAAIVIPLLLWLVILTGVYDVSLYEATSADAFVIFYALLCILVGAGTYLYFNMRRYSLGLIGLGLLMLLIQGLILVGFGFEGKVSVGEGEEAGPVNLVYARRWEGVPRLPLMLVSAKTALSPSDAKDESCTVMLDGKTVGLTKKGEIEWNSLRITLDGIYTAPLFILSNLNNKELEGGYIKIDWSDVERSFFQFRVLPHRFYASLPDAEQEIWRREDKKWRKETSYYGNSASHKFRDREASRIKTPDRLHIRIMRNKLTILDKIVAKGQAIDFDGHRLVFREGATWAMFRIRKAPSFFLLYAGAVVFGVGLTLLFIRRGS